MKQCPRCASEISDIDYKCPRCGMAIEENSKANIRKNRRLEKKAEKKRLKEQKKQEKLEKLKIKTDFSQFKKKEYMNKKQAQNALDFEIDSEGQYDINTDDVEIIDKRTTELLKERERQTYSIKKARGEYQPEKIRWWEIYKLVNRSFARRKIKKEVNKAAKIKPDFVSKPKLLSLAIFLGWCGAHNFYAQNKRKGWFILVCLTLWIGVISLAVSSSFFASIEISVGGFAGFIVMMLWIYDVINIIFNNYKYRLQKIAFISNLNVETRAKLGEKYIDMELYQKPWWVRLKVWLDKKRRDYAEYKHERRQRLIEKEKAKQAKLDEQAKINAEIAAYEEKEEQKLKEEKIKKQIDKEVLDEIKTLDEQSKKEPKPFSKKKEAKVKVDTKKNKK